VANSQELQIILKAKDEASKTIAGFNGSLADTAKAGAALGAGFTVSQKIIEGFINVALDAARAIGKLAAEAEQISNKALISGFSTDSVQGLQRLAKGAGVAGDAVFSAISKMQRAAVDGKVGFEKLGMGAQEFLRLTPEAQLKAIADKIMAFPTAAQRAAAAMDLFGRSGAELLPVLEQVAKGTTASVVGMSSDQIEALKKVDDSLDELGGAWEDFKNQVIAAASAAGGTTFLDALASQLRGIAAITKDQGLMKALGWLASIATGNIGAMAQVGIAGAAATAPSSGASFPVPQISGIPGLSSVTKDPNFRLPGVYTSAEYKSIVDAEKANAKAVETMRKHATEAAKLSYALSGQAFQLEQAGEVLNRYLSTWVDFKPVDLAQDILDLNEALGQGPEMDPAVISGPYEQGAADAEKALKDLQDAHREQIASTLGGLANVFGEVREGLVAMGVDGDSALMRLTVGFQTALTAASNFMGALAKGDMIGMIGSAIGGVMGIASALGVGGNKVVMQVNDMRDAFFKAQGGFVEFSKKLAGLTNQDLTKKIFDAKTVEQYNAAVAEAMALIDGQAKAQQELQAAIEKYGFTIEELGPKFAQQKLDEQAGQLLKDFQLLSAAGVDVNAIIARMGPSLVEFVNTSIAAGATIPEAMRPMVDQLIASGQLLDANGNAFASAEAAGITFAQTLTESMQSVIDEIRNLVAALTGIPREVTTTVTTHHQDTYSGGGGGGGNEEPPMARGGVILPFIPRAAQGIVTARPGGSPVVVGEGGQAELVAPVAALARQIGAAAAAAVGGGGRIIQVVLDGKVVAEAVERQAKAGSFSVPASSVRR
jgi:hypothetical protein